MQINLVIAPNQESILSECGDPTPLNGYALFPNGKLYGETAFVGCNEGYGLVGDTYISCLAGQHWSSNTSCEKGYLDYIIVCVILFS